MMRVLHVIKAVGIAGAEQHLLTLLPGLRARGVDARLLLLAERANPQDDYLARMSALDVPVDRHLMARRHLDPSLITVLREDLRQTQPQIVHTHLLHADVYALPMAFSLKLPTVSSRHNDDPFRRRFPLRQLHRWLWRNTSAGIAISQHVAAFCQNVEGAPADKLFTIPYGMSYRDRLGERAAQKRSLQGQIGVSSEAVLIGMVGRLIEQKGMRYGIQAFSRIASEHPHAHLVIVGDGNLREVLTQEAEMLGLMGRVHFLGWRDDAGSLMLGFDIFLMPSLWEGFGLVLLEAMSAALPIVASRASAIPEIVVDGETGILAAPQDVDELAEALRGLLNDAPLRHHMGMMGQERLETTFSAARMIDQTYAVYQRIVPKGTP
jgi:glycosyltransferase involved in cell wall biosynthesis